MATHGDAAPYYTFESIEADRQTAAETEYDRRRVRRLKQRIHNAGLGEHYGLGVKDMFRIGQKHWRIPLTLRSDRRSVDECHFGLIRKLTEGGRLVVEEVFDEHKAYELTIQLDQTRFFFRDWSVRDYALATAGILGGLLSSYHCTQHVLPLAQHLLAGGRPAHLQ